MLLEGLTVMVTRPRPQGEVLCRYILDAGGQPIYFPTIDIIPPEDIAQFKQDIAHLDQYDMIIFISPQAVYQSSRMIKAQWAVFPSHPQFIAIGKGTANALTNAHLPVHAYAKHHWSSEGLLTLPLLQNVKNKKIAILRAETGRELIKDVLTKRGALVDNVIAYRRAIPTLDVRPCKALLDEHKVDIIIATSNEIVKNLVTLVGVQPVPLLVISERIFEFAKSLGFNSIFLAKNASHDAMMAELLKQKDYLCQMKKAKT